MMLVGERLKVVPLTVHLPLREVPPRLSEDLVLHGLTVAHEALSRYFGRHKARIAVAGLNPHAGEGGLFGDEESRIIRPAIERAVSLGIQALGPFPGDTVFRRAVEGEFDVVIGMYHDQALIPIKVLDFDRAVNVTLGLPILRTSVDHGTAYDLAGKGVASAGSMIAALELAASMVRASQRGSVLP
jgi:4-hydroxythreonine-4-phosphate dehydrogenase